MTSTLYQFPQSVDNPPRAGTGPFHFPVWVTWVPSFPRKRESTSPWPMATFSWQDHMVSRLRGKDERMKRPWAGISLRLPATRPLHPACPPPSARSVAATPLLLASQTASDNSSPVSESSLASFRAASSSPSGPSGLLHRGERFCSHWSAVLHFGPAPDSIPACWINRRIREAFP